MPGDAEPIVRVTENGPYRVGGGVPVRDAEGNAVEAPATYFLCRCGHSSNKPFCDGTHKKVGFQGGETADDGPIAEREEVYAARDIAIHDDRSVCSHAGHCTDNLPSVFKLRTESWIDPEGAPAETIASVIATCPSGALRHTARASDEPVEDRDEPQVSPSRDGPYRLTGAVQVVSADGRPYERRARQTLCRCGGSKNKPFCDGTHWHIRFRAG
jgi:CDGSH-type Zn-finger protein